MYEIIVGRSESEKRMLGLKGTVFLGKHYVKMGATTSLSNRIYMDVTRSHVVLVSGKRGSGKCLTGDTPVYLGNDKITEIKEIIEEKFKGNTIKKDDDWEYVDGDGTEVLSMDIINLKIEKVKIEKFWRRKAPKLLIKLTTQDNRSITCTTEHPLYIKYDNLTKEKKANEIIVGDELAYPKDLNLNSNIEFDKVLDIEYLLDHNEMYVYDLAIPINHNFIAGKIPLVVHNSYSLGVIAEEMSHLPIEIKNKIAVLMIDTMGIFWTMRFPNLKDEDLLDEWDLPKKSLDIDIYTPAGYFDLYKEKGIPTDFPFTINPSELSALDWCNAFEVPIISSIGVAIESSLSLLKNNYSVDGIISSIENNSKIEQNTKLAAINRFVAAKSWGIFSESSTSIKELVKAGKVSVIDISAYKEDNIKSLVTGIICKKLMEERVVARKKEEMEDVSRSHSYFSEELESTGEETPITWILIDEAHLFLKKENKTPATNALVTILREGRQPGISLILATQQPGEIHKDVITQTDIVISHRITARKDLEALNSMMQSYLYGDLQKYFNILPKMRGSALILDDNSEKIYPLQVRPRFTWHGGESPTALKAKGSAAEKLGL